MKNYHTIIVKFLGPTNSRGARVKLYSNRFKDSKIISYDYEFNSSYEIAAKWLEDNTFDVIGASECKEGYILISTTFKSLNYNKGEWEQWE